MVDNTPYIIVDNQKIPPISRASKIGSKLSDRPNREESPFGVIDRVTISKEAKQKSRYFQLHVSSDRPSLSSDAIQHLATIRPLLADAPEKNR